MAAQNPTQKQREQISLVQNAVWDLHRARDLLVQSKCSTSVLQAVEAALDKTEQELNELSTLM